MKRILLTIAFGLAALSAAAAQSHPPELQAVIEDARQECKDADGRDVTFGPKAVRKIELTGDRRDDYIVDLHGAECDGAASLYCGTGGCNVSILVARRDGSFVTVFDGRAHSYDILSGRGPRKLRFHLHGSFCGGHGAETCAKTHRITDKPFEFKEPR